MKRRKFLKIVGIGAAAPTIIARAIIEKPVPLITGEIANIMGVPIIESNGRLFCNVETVYPKEIAFSPLVESDVMLRVRDLLADHYLDKFDKMAFKVLYGGDNPR